MLKPSEIRNYEFKPVGRNAYKAEEVDAFFAEVLISYEKMYRENSELIKRINLLADKVDQYKHDEVDIKQAVLSAQKAADIIIRDAEESVADSKKEAEEILAAAKGEAMVIRTDAEKQAIADSDLLMSIAKDKAEDIIKKAKEKAHTILIAANNSASDKMGAANRTITSESLHYDMLKKEVSEFRASILAQYKAHIELISKLPELALEEASKIENEPAEEPSIDDVAEEIIDPHFYSSDDSDSVLEFVDSSDEDVEDVSFELSAEPHIDDDNTEEASSCEEDVVKTTLPYDFFGEESEIEFISDEQEEEIDIVINTDGKFETISDTLIDDEDNNDIVDVSGDDSVADVAFFDDDFEDVFSSDDKETDIYSENPEIGDITTDDTSDADSENDSSSSIIDDFGSYNSFFDSIEVIDTDVSDDRDEEQPRRGFFFRKK